MLEKYLAEKNISISELQKLFPDIAELMQNYQDISGAPGFEDEVNKIGKEIISLLKDRESQIESFVKSRSSAPESTETEISADAEESFLGDDFQIDLGDETTKPAAEHDVVIDLGEGLESLKVEVAGQKFTDVDFKQDIFLKILSAFGMDFHPKIKTGEDNIYYWVLDDKNYFVTYGMPFDSKIDVEAIGDDKMSNIIKSKVNYKTIEEITSAPGLDGLTDAITVEDKEPITGMTFRQVNESVDELFKIDSMPKLMTLLELSIRKFGCGCGSI